MQRGEYDASCLPSMSKLSGPGRVGTRGSQNSITALSVLLLAPHPSAGFNPLLLESGRSWNSHLCTVCRPGDFFNGHRFKLLVTGGLQMAEPATEDKLDVTNRCKLLSSNAKHLQIFHGLPHDLAEDSVVFCISDGLSVAAAPGMALDWRCRRMVRELGVVRSIQLPEAKPSSLAGVRRACIAAALRAAYGNAKIDDQPTLDTPPLNDATISHQCDVAFLRRGVRQRVMDAAANLLGFLQQVPALGAFLNAAKRLGAQMARAQLTPTYRPSLTLRLLKLLPWRCQRLGARLWVQAMFEAEVAASNRASQGNKLQTNLGRHPMAAIRTLPILSPEDCEAAVLEAEEYARTNGWLTDRHVSYPTTDIPIRELPKLSELWTTRIFPAVAEAFRSKLNLPDGSTVTPLDVFVVKYDAAAQRELAVHRDNGLLTFSLLLNEPSDFSGGGTYFESDGAVYRTSRGVGVLHSALVRHAGYPIDAGTRYVLVGFCGLSSPHLPVDYTSWRFGDPPWYVSSRIMTDEQILGRVWRLN